jgi:hypothetical protein
MKKVLTVIATSGFLVTGLLVTPYIFAADTTSTIVDIPVSAVPVSNPNQTPAITKTLIGIVDSVAIGDAAKGIKSELVVVDDNGQTVNFVVKNGTPVTDKYGKSVTLSDVQKNSKVTVEYTTKTSGTNKAQFIKLVE